MVAIRGCNQSLLVAERAAAPLLTQREVWRVGKFKGTPKRRRFSGEKGKKSFPNDRQF
jgi:hypothetical protein